MSGKSSLHGLDLDELVRRAQQGQTEAFERVVERCQGMAISYAFGRLGDAADAADAAQEAFIDAYRKLASLREPAAFPGWLRSIVATHADRLRRARRERPADELRLPDEEGPERQLLDREQHTWLSSLIGALPPHERVVFAMHHLAGTSYAEIAELVGVSEQAARTRARRARRRLRKQLEETMQQDLAATLTASRPSAGGSAAATVLFAAIETADVATARRVLDEHPELVETEERWDDTTAREIGLQPARHASPLIRAVGREHREMVELLLERGAAVNRTCGCAGGETPLWTAAVQGSTELVRLLLERGADPDRAAFTGITPLHAATIRGYDQIVSLLLDAGAKYDLVDDHGRTPNDRRAATGVVAVDEGEVRPTGGTVATGQLLETGIRALDLFSPLRRGRLVEMVAPPGAGALVLLFEVLHRLALLEGYEARVIGFEQAGVTQRELRHGVAELAPAAHIRTQLAAATADAGTRRAAFETAVAALAHAEPAHRPPPVTIVVQHPDHQADIEAALPDLLATSDLVIVLYDANMLRPTALPTATRVTLDAARARAGLYPAIDGTRSRGTFNDDEHGRVAEAAIGLLYRYAETDPDLALAPTAVPWMAAAQALHRYLAQPFHTTEPFTGQPGTTTPLEDTLQEVRAILAGSASTHRDVETGLHIRPDP